MLLVVFDSDQRLNDPVAIITEITMRTTQTTPTTRTGRVLYPLEAVQACEAQGLVARTHQEARS